MEMTPDENDESWRIEAHIYIYDCDVDVQKSWSPCNGSTKKMNMNMITSKRQLQNLISGESHEAIQVRNAAYESTHLAETNT